MLISDMSISETTALASTFLCNCKYLSFVPDSGYSLHLIQDVSVLIDLQKLLKPKSLTVASNNSELNVNIVGSIVSLYGN